jgi:hypothetical protein
VPEQGGHTGTDRQQTGPRQTRVRPAARQHSPVDFARFAFYSLELLPESLTFALEVGSAAFELGRYVHWPKRPRFGEGICHRQCGHEEQGNSAKSHF